MNNSTKTPVAPEVVDSLKTLPIAAKSCNARSYHPSYRSLSVIIDETPSEGAVRTLPSFLINESGALGRASAGVCRENLFFRVNTFDDAIAAYAEPLAD